MPIFDDLPEKIELTATVYSDPRGPHKIRVHQPDGDVDEGDLDAGCADNLMRFALEHVLPDDGPRRASFELHKILSMIADALAQPNVETPGMN